MKNPRTFRRAIDDYGVQHQLLYESDICLAEPRNLVRRMGQLSSRQSEVKQALTSLRDEKRACPHRVVSTRADRVAASSPPPALPSPQERS
jgi:hypothetical protein